MDLPPCPAEGVGDGDDALVLLWALLLEVDFDKALQQPVMLSEGLDQVVRLRQRPRLFHALLRLTSPLQVHQGHGGNDVGVDGWDGIGLHAQGDPRVGEGQAPAVIPRQIRLVSQNVAAVHPQSAGEVFQILLQRRDRRHRQMQEDGGRGRRENTDGVELLRRVGGEAKPHLLLHIPHGDAGQIAPPTGEVGKGIDQAGGEAQSRVVAA